MSKFKYLVLVVIIFAAIINLNAAKKRVLIEQFTGAWCQFCTDGTAKMDEIMQMYPDQVLGVKFHNGDKMAIPETDIIGAALGLTGYPTGNVDRAPVNVSGQTRIMIDRTIWQQVAEALMKQPAIVDIKLDWAYDESTGSIIASISATFEQAVSTEVRFNVYVIEDEVTGSGPGWDQANYYNNEPGHPFYQKGNPIKNYKHMQVVRATLGGPWGAENSIPQPINVGSKAKYTFEIKKNASWNIDKVKLIGMVVNYSQTSRQIINSVVGTKLKTTTAITQLGNLLDAAPTGETKEVKFTIKNTGTSAKNYNLNFSKSPKTTWKATLEPNENSITIPGGGTYEVKMKMPVESIGSGEAALTIEEEGGMTFARTFNVYSSDADYMSVNFDPSGNEFVPNYIRSISAYKTMFSIPIAHFTQLASRFNTVKVINFNLGESGEIPAGMTTTIDNLMNKNVCILFNGPLVYNSLNTNSPSTLGRLGISWNGMSTQGQTTQGKFNIAGIAADPISDGFSSQISIYYFLHRVRISNPSVASPIVTLQGVPDTIYATKHQFANSRAVCLGFNPAGVANQSAVQQLISKALNWMYKAPEPEVPQISAPTGIDFGEVAMTQSAEKSFEIKNIGKKDLIISDITIKGGDASAYSIVDKGMATLKPNEATNVVVKFSPTVIKFYVNASIEIASNDPNKPVATLSLAGKGKKLESVIDPVVINAQIYPNPVETNSQITFFVPETAKSVRATIVDILGKKVVEFNNLNIGANTLQLDNKLIDAGSYILVITIDDEMVTKRFNVIK